jgi:hypothetical protein
MFFDSFLKLYYLTVGEVHGKVKLVNSAAEIISVSQNTFRRIAIKKYTELVAPAAIAWIQQIHNKKKKQIRIEEGKN